MKKVLFLDGSFITNEASYTTNLMDLYAKEFVNVERINLNNSVFNKQHLSQDNFPQYWMDIDADAWINKLKETDLLVLSATLVNFNVPTVVKNFIDGIAIAEKTFSYTRSTNGQPVGLLDNLNVVLVISQGGPEEELPSYQKVWLEKVFNFVGAKTINFIEVNGTKIAPLDSANPQEYAQTRLAEFQEIVKKIGL
ncbi:FMN-dependent NADH-azoreductase [Ureaplasma sp. ES3154-GEN]|uniref:FMN-dependent NADH-azoreductase n=1 Tax=Ureaplasma sp. ES3154-GEN TaxID=2984844 RepID=UPI0021E72A57|nr:FMN-dependent NADH-azoreductase [Ureaplasma sp. ES3154-GEN]MCV3743422.1 FMN-dependent NADH-azoreductase [Ureaplasma sp. ES3154-GEN]